MSEDDDLPDGPTSPSRDHEWVREPLADMKRREAQEMPPWFLPGLAGAIAWTVLGLWLMQKANWPYAFGYRDNCPYGFRGCEFLDIMRSPALLKHPTGTSLALFTWFMTVVAAIIGIIIHAARKRGGQYLLLLAILAGAFAVLALSPDATAK